MDLLEQVKKISGADTILGICFSKGAVYTPILPDGSRLIGYTDSVFFCTIEGYQDTVFAVTEELGYGVRICPLAYDFREFLRLILACGSAAAAAAIVLFGKIPPCPEGCQYRMAGLERLGRRLSLIPVADPCNYVQTVQQVIDCRSIRCL